MVLIYMPLVSNRAHYIFSLYFTDLLGVEYKLTDSTEQYEAHTGPKICYATEPCSSGLFIYSQPLLFLKELIHQLPETEEYQKTPVIFGHSDKRSLLPFDPFAAGFYMVTRYEEYLATEKDRYGRYRLSESIAGVGEFIGKPVVNLWARLVKDLLDQHYPGIPENPRKYKFVPSIDVDHAYAFGHRKLSRVFGGFLRDLKRTDFAAVKFRAMVQAGKEKDPYDTYDLIQEIHEKHNLKPLIFMLFADYGGNDNNVSLDDPVFHQLLRKLEKMAVLGIHPSLASNRKLSTLENEVFGLADILNRDVTISRQHFLKIKFPWTYRNLIRLGITDDYSMGYASSPGFRAGIASPFRYFDLINDAVTELVIHPVSVMDVTLADYLRLDKDESLELIMRMVDIVRSVNGEFVSLWHNESFNETGRWKGWLETYEKMLKYAAG